ncbi:MAG: flagellar hook-basal body protein [Acidobacteriota bacterium]
MDSAIYNAASGMIAQQVRLDVLANNLANVSTPGFRRDGTFLREFRRFGEGINGAVNGVVRVPATYTLDRAGTLLHTGNPTDFSLEGPGLFAIQTDLGVLYTRDGSFTRDPDGKLVTSRGESVLGTSGKPLRLPPGLIGMAADGTLSVNGQQVGRLKIVDIPMAEQIKTGEGLVLPNRADAVQAARRSTSVRQGFREGSSVNAVDEMVEMISAQRAFETYRRVLSLAINDVDRQAVTVIAGPTG